MTKKTYSQGELDEAMAELPGALDAMRQAYKQFNEEVNNLEFLQKRIFHLGAQVMAEVFIGGEGEE